MGSPIPPFYVKPIPSIVIDGLEQVLLSASRQEAAVALRVWYENETPDFRSTNPAVDEGPCVTALRDRIKELEDTCQSRLGVMADRDRIISGLQQRVAHYQSLYDGEVENVRKLCAAKKESEDQLRKAQDSFAAAHDRAVELEKENRRLRSIAVDIGGIGGSQDNPSPIKAVAQIAELKNQVALLQRDRQIDAEHHLRRERTLSEGLAAASASGNLLYVNDRNWRALTAISQILTPDRAWSPEGLVAAVQAVKDNHAILEQQNKDLKREVECLKQLVDQWKDRATTFHSIIASPCEPGSTIVDTTSTMNKINRWKAIEKAAKQVTELTCAAREGIPDIGGIRALKQALAEQP